ncbi:hypothetical protein EHW66_20250 [Erwinia psidii]|uniref:hypothetical protein n=1 Tax=Erwinia psidii TaxID=69224 RepID=UPI00226B21E5|nr:hypothetical protein [Erwinia psidii]MCX8967219.1 hypothetical protein [Erwinia psidii]
MTHLNDSTPTEHNTCRDNLNTPAGPEKGRLSLALKRSPPAERAFMSRLCLIFAVAGYCLMLAGGGVWWCSHWMFGEILSPQYADPQAARVMAIWNAMMYFVPGTMIITGAVMVFLPALISLIDLVPCPVPIRHKPAKN